jgi:hypothetical protein
MNIIYFYIKHNLIKKKIIIYKKLLDNNNVFNGYIIPADLNDIYYYLELSFRTKFKENLQNILKFIILSLNFNSDFFYYNNFNKTNEYIFYLCFDNNSFKFLKSSVYIDYNFKTLSYYDNNDIHLFDFYVEKSKKSFIENINGLLGFLNLSCIFNFYNFDFFYYLKIISNKIYK